MEKKLKTLTIAEKLNLIKSFEKSSLSNIPDEEMDDSLPTNIEVFKALKIVRKYAQFNTLNNEVNSLSNIEKSLTISIINSKKQSMITNFFK